jgi:phage gp36-like protein
MIYLTIDTVLARISLTDLNVLTESNDDSLNAPELDAIQEVSSYLSYRYKTDLIFAPEQAEEEKHAIINRITVDILLYNLHAKVNPRNIPDKRIQLRDDAIKYLSEVANPRSEIQADFLPIKERTLGRGADISWGSKPKRYNKY